MLCFIAQNHVLTYLKIRNSAATNLRAAFYHTFMARIFNLALL